MAMRWATTLGRITVGFRELTNHLSPNVRARLFADAPFGAESTRPSTIEREDSDDR